MSEQTLSTSPIPELAPERQSPLRQFLWLTLGVGSILFVLFSLADYYLGQNEERAHALQSVTGARAIVLEDQHNVALWADILAQRLKDASRKDAQDLLLSTSSLWPLAVFSLYDDRGVIVTVRGGRVVEGTQPLVFAGKGESLVGLALQGSSASGYSLVEDFVAVSAAAPVRNVSVRAVLVSLLFDPGYLMQVKNRVGADALVLGLNEFSPAQAHGTGMEEDTMPGQDVALPFAKGEVLPAKGTCVSVQVRGVSRDAGIVPLGPDAAAPSALLMVFPVRAPFALSGWLAFLAASGGLLAALPLFWWRKRYASKVFSGMAEGLGRLIQEGFEPPATWPEPLLKVFRALEQKQAVQRAAMDKAAHEREEAVQRLAKQDKGPCSEEFRVFFEASSHGMFQIEPDGTLVRVNQSLASMLGYESPSHLLAERSTLEDFCLYTEDGLTLLRVLCEHPRRKHVITLRQRNGKVRNFTIMSLHVKTEGDEPRRVIDGFLISRRLEELVELLRVSWEQTKSHKASLALLLAAVSHQSQLYLASQFQADNDEASLPGSVSALNFLFTDLYQIALAETEEAEPIAVPMDVFDIMRQACEQAAFVLRARGVALHCDTSADLVSTVSGVAPLLRHALVRALFAVIMAATGGRAYLSVASDPNAPRLPDVTRLLFSASWNASMEPVHNTREPAGDDSQNSDPMPAFVSEFDDTPESWYAAKPGSEDRSGSVAINLAEERAILHYLVQKLHGELLHGFYTRDARSVQFIVQLEHLPEHFRDISLGEPAPQETPQDLPAGQTGLPGREEEEPASSILRGPGAGTASFLNVKETVLPASSDSLPLQVLGEDEETAALGKATDSGEGLDILLVDDSQDNRLLFSSFLRDTRHRITEAHTGQEGVDAFLRKKFDIIFMDMEMPLMDGYQTTRVIRALEADAGAAPTPIVAQTAHVLPEFRHRFLLAGCTEILAKPFSKNALLTLLDAFIAMRGKGAAIKAG